MNVSGRVLSNLWLSETLFPYPIPTSTLPSDKIYERVEQTQLDLNILKGNKTTRYFRGRPEVKKFGNLHLAWDFDKNALFRGASFPSRTVTKCDRRDRLPLLTRLCEFR